LLYIEDWQLWDLTFFATVWNVDGNWNGFSGEELWGGIGV